MFQTVHNSNSQFKLCSKHTPLSLSLHRLACPVHKKRVETVILSNSGKKNYSLKVKVIFNMVMTLIKLKNKKEVTVAFVNGIVFDMLFQYPF